MPRPRTPTHLRILQGNPAKRPLPEGEPCPPAASDDVLNPPAHLTERGNAAWKRMAKIIFDMGVLSVADTHALERLCETYAAIAELTEALQARGAYCYEVNTAKDGRMIRPYPEVGLLADADRRFLALLIQFGLTPAARTKVKTLDKSDAGDPAARFFG